MKTTLCALFLRGMLGALAATSALAADYNARDFTVAAHGFAIAGNGSTDDRLALQKAIDRIHTEGGGQLFLNGNQRYRVLSPLLVKAGVRLVGDYANLGNSGSGVGIWNHYGSALVLAGTGRLDLAGGAAAEGILVMRAGLTLPVTDSATSFTGVGVQLKGSDAELRNCAIMGFGTGVQSIVGTLSNLRLHDLNIDCLNGVQLQGASSGVVLKRIHVFPFLSTGSNYPSLRRNGSGYLFSNVNGAEMTNCFVHARGLKGIVLDNCDNNTFRGVGVDNMYRLDEIDPVGIGIELRNGSASNTFIGCQVASQHTGFYLNAGAGTTTRIRATNVWNFTGVGATVLSGAVELDACGFRGAGIVANRDGVSTPNAGASATVRECHFNSLRYALRRGAGALTERGSLVNTGVTRLFE
jgi:hypothetical protein